MAEKVSECNELEIRHVRNLPMSKIFTTKNIEDAMDYEPKDNDIIICSYPKTGTTWMSYIVWKILHKNEKLPGFNEMTMKYVPFIEATGTDVINSLEYPRAYKHHFPYNYMKVNKNAKYIYTYRNPMDTAVSYYYFYKSMHGKFGLDYVNFDEYFENFLVGNVGYGDFFDHVLEFYQHRNDSHFLLISYEDLHCDKRQMILKVAKFLGESYFQELIEDESLMEEILRVTEFNYMKKNVDSQFSLQKDGQIKKFDTAMFRKGIVGDSKNLMKEEQIEALKCKMLQKVNDEELLNMWFV